MGFNSAFKGLKGVTSQQKEDSNPDIAFLDTSQPSCNAHEGHLTKNPLLQVISICRCFRYIAVALLVEVLRYKPEGHGFDSR